MNITLNVWHDWTEWGNNFLRYNVELERDFYHLYWVFFFKENIKKKKKRYLTGRVSRDYKLES